MVFLYILAALLGILLLYLLFLTVCALAVRRGSEYDRDSRFYRAVLTGVDRMLLLLMGIRLHVSGTEKLPVGQKIVFVSNHRSNIDPIVQWAALREWKPAFLSKAENFRIPIIGRLILKCCFMPIDRENARNALKTIRRAAALVKADEVSIGVYPEGTRSKTGALLPFHNGVFKIAQLADAPLAVLAMRGTEQTRVNFPLRRTHVFIEVLEVLPAESLRHRRTEEIGTEVAQRITAALSAHSPSD